MLLRNSLLLRGDSSVTLRLLSRMRMMSRGTGSLFGSESSWIFQKYVIHLGILREQFFSEHREDEGGYRKTKPTLQMDRCEVVQVRRNANKSGRLARHVSA